MFYVVKVFVTVHNVFVEVREGEGEGEVGLAMQQQRENMEMCLLFLSQREPGCRWTWSQWKRDLPEVRTQVHQCFPQD